jgi:large subunit ribosomal protein L32
MAALPKRRISRSRKLKRRATRVITLVKTEKCRHCGSEKLSHRACPKCHRK